MSVKQGRNALPAGNANLGSAVSRKAEARVYISGLVYAIPVAEVQVSCAGHEHTSRRGQSSGATSFRCYVVEFFARRYRLVDWLRSSLFGVQQRRVEWANGRQALGTRGRLQIGRLLKSLRCANQTPVRYASRTFPGSRVTSCSDPRDPARSRNPCLTLFRHLLTGGWVIDRGLVVTGWQDRGSKSRVSAGLLVAVRRVQGLR